MQIAKLKLLFMGHTVILITKFNTGHTIAQVLSESYKPSQRDMWIDAVIAKILEGKFK